MLLSNNLKLYFMFLHLKIESDLKIVIKHKRRPGWFLIVSN